MASLWLDCSFGFLSCSSVSSLSRTSILRRRRIARYSYVPPSYYAVLDMIDFSSLRGLSFSDHRFLFRSVNLCFMFYVSRFMFYCFYLSDWISMVSVCVGLWIWNVCVWYCVYGSGVSSLVSARVNPRGSLSSPLVASVVVSSCVTSPSSSPVVVVFSVLPLRRLYLGISTLVSAFVLQPLVLRPSFSSFVGLSSGLLTVGGGYCHKCRS